MNEVPARGDVAWLSMDPARGREQRGHRPHLVLSDQRLGKRTGLLIVVPMTRTQRPWATRVKLSDGSYAIGEQPRTVSADRVTRVESRGYDVSEVVVVIGRLIGA